MPVGALSFPSSPGTLENIFHYICVCLQCPAGAKAQRNFTLRGWQPQGGRIRGQCGTRTNSLRLKGKRQAALRVTRLGFIFFLTLCLCQRSWHQRLSEKPAHSRTPIHGKRRLFFLSIFSGPSVPWRKTFQRGPPSAPAVEVLARHQWSLSAQPKSLGGPSWGAFQGTLKGHPTLSQE